MGQVQTGSGGGVMSGTDVFDVNINLLRDK